jgi:hypothetical protein
VAARPLGEGEGLGGRGVPDRVGGEVGVAEPQPLEEPLLETELPLLALLLLALRRARRDERLRGRLADVAVLAPDAQLGQLAPAVPVGGRAVLVEDELEALRQEHLAEVVAGLGGRVLDPPDALPDRALDDDVAVLVLAFLLRVALFLFLLVLVFLFLPVFVFLFLPVFVVLVVLVLVVFALYGGVPSAGLGLARFVIALFRLFKLVFFFIVLRGLADLLFPLLAPGLLDLAPVEGVDRAPLALDTLASKLDVLRGQRAERVGLAGHVLDQEVPVEVQLPLRVGHLVAAEMETRERERGNAAPHLVDEALLQLDVPAVAPVVVGERGARMDHSGRDPDETGELRPLGDRHAVPASLGLGTGLLLLRAAVGGHEKCGECEPQSGTEAKTGHELSS